jgi:chromosome segregation ATPase
MDAITIPWLEEQIAFLSRELNQAKELRDNMAEQIRKAQDALAVLEERVVDITGCLQGLKEELKLMLE